VAPTFDRAAVVKNRTSEKNILASKDYHEIRGKAIFGGIALFFL